MTAADFLPDRRKLRPLAAAALRCRGCHLFQHATQTVFGEGKSSARLILIGEQPGDQEDRAGRPFVGPAGRVLDECLEEAGLDRNDLYVTNAVKHFKWEPRGQRRLHKQPSARELQACRPWWDAELAAIQPEGIVCLGATAARFILGSNFRVTQQRGKVQQSDGPAWVIATWHPSAILRAPQAQNRHRMRSELLTDLKQASLRLNV